MSCIESIFAALKQAGVEVRLPAQKRDICLSPYAVVFESERGLVNGMDMCKIQIRVFVPLENYSALAPFTETVREAMRPLRGRVRETGRSLGAGVEDKFCAHRTALEYAYLPGDGDF